MMEEAEKRRERLCALRSEAAQAEVPDNNVDTSGGASSSLLKPFSETSGSMGFASEEEVCVAPRFDYYTDPMAAFSANKRRNTPASQNTQTYFSPPRPRNPEPMPSPAHQWQQNSYSPNQRFQQPRGGNQNYASFGSPREMATSYPMHQGNPPEPWNSATNNSYFHQSGFPRGFTSPGHGYRPVRSPGLNYGRSGGQYFSNSPGYGFGRGGSPSPNSGRGRGRWNKNSMSLASGWSGGKDRGPEQYILASMLEDPWKDLTPVIWKRNAFSNRSNISSKPWFSKSIGAKKPRVSEVSDKSGSQPSLAEILAASFDDASGDGSSN